MADTVSYLSLMKFIPRREINGLMSSVTYLVNILPASGSSGTSFPRLLSHASEARVLFTRCSTQVKRNFSSLPPSLPPSLPLDISLLLDGGCALTYVGLISSKLGLPAFCALLK